MSALPNSLSYYKNRAHELEVRVMAAEARAESYRAHLNVIATGRVPKHPRFMATERALREYAREALAERREEQ